MKILMLSALLLASACYGYDIFVTINFQSSTNGSDWTTFGSQTYSMDGSNAPCKYFYGLGYVNNSQPTPGTRYADIVVMCGTNCNIITTPFYSVSNFPFIGTSNTIYRPEIVVTNQPVIYSDTNTVAFTNIPPAP